MTKILLSVCNLCFGDDIETKATQSEKLTLNGIEYEIDLCDEHYVKWFKPFAAEVNDHGTRVGGRKLPNNVPRRETMRDPRQCEIGDCARVCDGYAGQVQHGRQAHKGNPEFEEWYAKKQDERP